MTAIIIFLGKDWILDKDWKLPKLSIKIEKCKIQLLVVTRIFFDRKDKG